MTSLSSAACSSLTITDKQSHIYHGRTLEFSADLPSWLTYYPKNRYFQKKTPDGKNGINYHSKYEILTIGTENYFDGDEHNIFQSLNSGGASFSADLVPEANLTTPEAKYYDRAIPVIAIDA